MKKRSLILVLSTLLVVLFAFTSYSAPITLRLTKWLSFPEEKGWIEKWAKKYEQAHPDVKIEIDLVTTGYDEKLLTSFAGGEAPDIFYVHSVNLPAYVEQGLCVPLDKYIDGPNGINTKDIFPAIWKATTYKGKKYGYSATNGVQILYFNKRMFRESGLRYPDKNWTWKDLAETAQKLTKKDKDGRITQYGFQCDEYNRVFVTYVWSMGGKLFDNEEAPKKPLFNNTIGVEAAKYLADLVMVYGVAPAPGVPGALGYREAFRTQKVAMILDGSWMIRNFINQKDLEFGTAVVPKGKKRTGWYDCCFWAMSTQTKYPDIVWDVIKHMSSVEVALDKADYGGPQLMGMPSWQTAYKDPRWKPCDLVAPVVEQMKYARPELSFWNAGKFAFTMLASKLQEIIIMKKDPKKALDELAQETIEEIIKKMPK